MGSSVHNFVKIEKKQLTIMATGDMEVLSKDLGNEEDEIEKLCQAIFDLDLDTVLKICIGDHLAAIQDAKHKEKMAAASVKTSDGTLNFQNPLCVPNVARAKAAVEKSKETLAGAKAKTRAPSPAKADKRKPKE